MFVSLIHLRRVTCAMVEIHAYPLCPLCIYSRNLFLLCAQNDIHQKRSDFLWVFSLHISGFACASCSYVRNSTSRWKDSHLFWQLSSFVWFNYVWIFDLSYEHIRCVRKWHGLRFYYSVNVKTRRDLNASYPKLNT